MKLYLRSVCQLAFFSLCCVLITVRESDSSPFVPGRCMCRNVHQGVRGQLRGLAVYPKSPSCDKITVIVTLRSNNMTVCLDPDKPMGKQLIRCWNRAHKLGRETTLCLRRRRGRGRGQSQRSRQRSRGQSRKASSSQAQ